jgi:DNA-binding CsgD family transcriptional regulator
MWSSDSAVADRAQAGLPPASITAALAPRPERRRAASLSSQWMTLVLEELDYGVVLLNAGGQVLHCNLAARRCLETGQHPLRLANGHVSARHAADDEALSDALAAAERAGRRCLLKLSGGNKPTAQPANVVVVPLNRDVSQAAVLLVLERPQLCGDLAAQWFALRYKLTPTETAVLKVLAAGDKPGQVAQQQGVAISTVRSQIQSIRDKSGAGSISELLRQLAMLPPLMSALRMELA